MPSNDPETLHRLLDAVKAAPDDDAPRLVLADWLEDQGQADRAEFIRIQVAIAHPFTQYTKQVELERLEGLILEEYRARWLPPLARGAQPSFVRGMLDVWIRDLDGLRSLELWVEEVGPWLECLHCNDLPDEGVVALAASRVLDHVVSLDLQNCLKEEQAATLLGSPYLARLARLRLRLLNDEAVAVLSQAPCLDRITELEVGGLGPGEVAELACSPRLAALRRLNLASNYIGAEGAASLARSPNLAMVTELNLNGNEIGDAGAEALAESSNVASLAKLVLSRNGIGESGAAALARSPHLARLAVLDLYMNRIGDAGAMALAESPHLVQLEELCLGKNAITDAGATALAQSSYLVRLCRLDCGMTDQKWRTARTGVSEMMQHLEDCGLLEADDRRLRLFACACCRHIWHALVDERSREAVEVAERYADGLVGDAEMATAMAGAAAAMGNDEQGQAFEEWRSTFHGPWAVCQALSLRPDPLPDYSAAICADQATIAAFYDVLRRRGVDIDAIWAEQIDWDEEVRVRQEEEAAQCDLLRDVFGNPFRAAAFDPSWLTPAVAHLARAIYDGRAFETMPQLAEALIEAGCDDLEILDHCTSGGPHVLGCWVLDRILGNG